MIILQFLAINQQRMVENLAGKKDKLAQLFKAIAHVMWVLLSIKN